MINLFHLLPSVKKVIYKENMTKLAAETHDDKAIASKKPSIKEVISNFCGYTTAHGLGRLADGGGVFRRITWSLFCIGALVMFVVQTYNLFVIYLSRPVSTVVTVQHDSVSSVYFTFCKVNKKFQTCT